MGFCRINVKIYIFDGGGRRKEGRRRFLVLFLISPP